MLRINGGLYGIGHFEMLLSHFDGYQDLKSRFG
jgi:hypothetical protein